MAETIYDVAIIGGGPAGYTAAIRAGQYKLNTVLIDKSDKLGGTCLHVGCIPTKALLFDAEVYDHFKNAAEYGIDLAGEAKVNWPNVLARKNDIIAKHTKGLNFLMKKNKVTVVTGWGVLGGPAKDGVFTVDVDNNGAKQTIKAKNILLATGSDAKLLPGLAADDRVLTNIEMLSVPEIPKSMVVIGAGAVGVEFASIFNSFGTEITLVEYLPRLVPVEDEEISKELLRTFKKRGIDCNPGAKFEKVEKTKTGVKVTYTTSDGKQVVKEAEKVLIAVGRGPKTEGIGLEKTRIKVERGFIHVDEWQQTAEPGIYAIGDIVAGLPQLAHVGAMAGMVAVAKIAGKYARAINRNHVPGCTYTEPQIGSVGLTEAAAKEKGHDVKVGKFPFAGNSKASIVGSHEGFIKVIADKKHGEILGVHIIGPQATELISEAVVAMQMEATVEDLIFTIHAHPTLSEGMLDAYGSVEGMAINA